MRALNENAGSTWEPRVSLVVSTIGRPNDLRRMLQSLVAQTYSDFEVIVVDQSRNSATADVMNEFSEALALRHVPMQELGVSRGRNRGLALARGTIVGFPDDDCIYLPNVLAEVVGIFSARMDIDALSCGSTSPGGGGGITRFESTAGPVDRSNLLTRFVEFTFFARHEQFDGVWFNESIGGGAGTPWGADEGPDLVLRMFNRGCRMWYFPHIEVIHPSPLMAVDEKLLKRSYSYSCGRGRLYRVHHYPFRVIAYSMARSLAGCVLNLMRLRRDWARYYWLAFYGKLRGYLAGA